MKKLLAALLLPMTSFAYAQEFNVDTIVQKGNLEHYINYVFVGDGYTESELPLYHGHVDTIMESFFNRIPYSNYVNFFNVFAIDVISPESGVKHPRTASDCPGIWEFPHADPTNYFGTSFDLWGVHRLIYPQDMTLLESVLADNFPAYDQVLFIGNTHQYGGAGGGIASGTANEYSVEIMLHECGHSFAGLSDEYWAGDVYAVENYNMTHEDFATTSAVKWQEWLDVSGTGIYQYCCGGTSDEWYKPHTDCLMEYLEREFCPVCRQRTIERIYEIVNPIVTFTPATTALAVTEPMDFKLTEVMLPIPNTLKVEWKLNGVIIATNVDSVRIMPSMIADDANTLVAQVTDTTAMLRVAPSFTHHINNVTWNINNNPSGIEVMGKTNKYNVKLFPNPAQDYLYVQSDNFKQANSVILTITDVRGVTFFTEEIDVKNNQLDTQINVNNLTPGNYYLNITVAGQTQSFKISIVR